jgi:hypothetical protein
MPARAIFSVALVVFLFGGISHAADAPKLPSTKASVVIPLLEQFSPRDSTLTGKVKEAKKILGDNCHCEVGGSDPDPLRQCYYFLDDGTQVEVAWSRETFSILIFFRGQPAKTVYPNSAK